MKALPSPKDVCESLQKDSLFQDWKKQHKTSFLSHFFCSVNNEFKAKTNWEIGYYNPESVKMVVFTASQENQFEIKPEDDVFKKQDESVEELKFEEVRTSVDKASSVFKEKLPEYFPKEDLGDGFLVLQTFKGKTFWNMSFITKSLKFVNMKLDVKDCSVVSHETINLVEGDSPLVK